MKGAYKGYFAMPNLGRLRARVVNPNKDLTSKIREKVMGAIAEVINENALAIKAKVADFVVNECGLTFKDKNAEAQVAAVTGSIFDIYAGSTAESLAAITGDKGDGDVEDDGDVESEGDAATHKEKGDKKDAEDFD